MALAKLRNESYLISRVVLFNIGYNGELHLNLQIDLNDGQSITLSSRMHNIAHVKFLKNSMNYLISHLENDADQINITEMIMGAEKWNLECTLNTKQIFQPNKEGIFVKVPNDTPSYKADYIFVSADKFEVTFSVVPLFEVVETHLYVEGNPTYLPAVIIHQKVNSADGSDYNRFGSRYDAKVHAEVLERRLLENSKQGYIEFEKVVNEFIEKREIPNLKYVEVTTKLD